MRTQYRARILGTNKQYTREYYSAHDLIPYAEALANLTGTTYEIYHRSPPVMDWDLIPSKTVHEFYETNRLSDVK